MNSRRVVFQAWALYVRNVNRVSKSVISYVLRVKNGIGKQCFENIPVLLNGNSTYFVQKNFRGILTNHTGYLLSEVRSGGQKQCS